MPTIEAASYARTSTDYQKSCPEQLEICRRTIQDRGWQLRYQLKDEGHKGASSDRSGYLRLLEHAHDERINAVVVWKLDRLFRSLKEASIAQELFTANKVSILSCTEPFDTTTAMGRFVFGFLANWAQFETEVIRERACLGHARRAREGKWSGSVVPYGYLRGPDGKLAVNEEEADMVRRLHRNYGRLGGDRELASWLNGRGLQHRGRPWTADRARKALLNPLAIGELRSYGATATHAELAIVDARTFQRTAAVRQGLRHSGRPCSAKVRRQTIDRVMDAYLDDLRRSSDA